MSVSYLASPVYGTLILARVFSHLCVLTGLLIYQFVFRDFVNPSVSVPLYFTCSIVLLIDGAHLILDSKYHRNRAVMQFLFALDSVFLLCLILFLGIGGLYPALLISLFLFFAFKLFGTWRGLTAFALWLFGLFLAGLIWRGEIEESDRVSLSAFAGFTLIVNFLAGGFAGHILRKFYERAVELREKGFFHLTQTARPPARLQPALSLSRKIKPFLTSLSRFLSSKKLNLDEKAESTEADDRQIEKQIRGFRKFVDDFIEFAEPEQFELNALDFNKLIQKTLKELSSHPLRPAGLSESVSLRSSGWICGSAPHLEKALKHILINAFEAMKLKSQPVLTVGNYDEGNQLLLEIADNGQGLEAEDARQVFEPLFSRRLGLRGMGLALTLKIIEAHRGHISFSSEFQKGSRLRITLPLLSPLPHSRKMSLSA